MSANLQANIAANSANFRPPYNVARQSAFPLRGMGGKQPSVEVDEVEEKESPLPNAVNLADRQWRPLQLHVVRNKRTQPFPKKK